MRLLVIITLLVSAAFGQSTSIPAAAGGGGGTGTVTSVTVAGTANQLTATGTCTVTLTGTCTLSIPSALQIPGTINKLTLTQPATGSTLTIIDGKTLTASNTLTFTGTDASSIAFGTGGTATYTANNLSVFAATSSAQLAGVINDETGTGGVLVFSSSPSLTTPTIASFTNATHNHTNAAGGGTLTLAGAAFASQGSTTTLLHGNAGGNPSFASVVSADLNITATTCVAPQVLRVISSAAAGTCVNNDLTQNSQSAAYTTVLTDDGKQIYHPSADTTARTWTIDSNANVAYALGAQLTFINDTSGGVITIAITTDTLVWAGAGTTGSRTLAANGIAVATKIGTTRWIINGVGLT